MRGVHELTLGTRLTGLLAPRVWPGGASLPCILVGRFQMTGIVPLRNLEPLGEVSVCAEGRTGQDDVGAFVEGRGVSGAELTWQWRWYVRWTSKEERL